MIQEQDCHQKLHQVEARSCFGVVQASWTTPPTSQHLDFQHVVFGIEACYTLLREYPLRPLSCDSRVYVRLGSMKVDLISTNERTFITQVKTVPCAAMCCHRTEGNLLC